MYSEQLSDLAALEEVSPDYLGQKLDGMKKVLMAEFEKYAEKEKTFAEFLLEWQDDLVQGRSM